MRVIRHARERQRLVVALQSMALKDALTGLYNRRGFITLAEEHMKLAQRTGACFALAFVDLDGMKRINDQLGHEFGDQAIIATADILRSTFRASDIAARLGGDEFIVLVRDATPVVAGRIKKRLQHAAALHNCQPGVVPVAFSVGFAHHNGGGFRSGDNRPANDRSRPGYVPGKTNPTREPYLPRQECVTHVASVSSARGRR